MSQTKNIKDDAIVLGVSIFDPRDGAWKLSTNPALILGDLWQRGIITIGNNLTDEQMWERIAKMADYMDEQFVELGYKEAENDI